MAEAALSSKGDTLEGSFPYKGKKKEMGNDRMNAHLYTHRVTQTEDNYLRAPQLSPLPPLTPVSTG